MRMGAFIEPGGWSREPFPNFETERGLPRRDKASGFNFFEMGKRSSGHSLPRATRAFALAHLYR
jgi:hypothetical protein